MNGLKTLMGAAALVGMASTAAAQDVETDTKLDTLLSCADFGDGEFTISHESFARPLFTVNRSDFDFATQTSVATVDNTNDIGVSYEDVIYNTDAGNGSFRGTLSIDYQNSTCTISEAEDPSNMTEDNTVVVMMPMAPAPGQ